MTTKKEQHIGIDVGKTWLDMATWGEEQVKRVTNDETGVREIIRCLEKSKPKLIAVEASGGYEKRIVQAMMSKGLSVAVMNPTRVRALARAKGTLAKTDKIDARLIAEFASKIEPPTTASKSEKEILLKELVNRRTQLVEMRVAELNRLQTAHDSLREGIREHISWMKEKILLLEVEIEQLVGSLPEWQEMAKLLDSIPGVGFVTAVTVLADMPELGHLNRQQVAALAGLAPFNRDSGQQRGRRRIFGGRKNIRHVLYMACLSAIKHNPSIRSLFLRLKGEGKVFKVAITACMRKMLTIMNAMARKKEVWNYPRPVPI